MNRLANTRCYLCGPIESCKDGGIDWRGHICHELQHLNIQWLDPCHKPTTFVRETPEDNRRLCALREAKSYEAVRNEMLWIRRVDLRLVHIADFLIVHLDQNLLTCGTWEEIVWANQEKKPILIHYAQGKSQAPLWLFGMIPHQMIFSTWHDLQSYLDCVDRDPRLNADQITPWSENRWHLFNFHGV
jgi:hypothetical protein